MVNIRLNKELYLPHSTLHVKICARSFNIKRLRRSVDVIHTCMNHPNIQTLSLCKSKQIFKVRSFNESNAFELWCRRRMLDITQLYRTNRERPSEVREERVQVEDLITVVRDCLQNRDPFNVWRGFIDDVKDVADSLDTVSERKESSLTVDSSVS